MKYELRPTEEQSCMDEPARRSKVKWALITLVFILSGVGIYAWRVPNNFLLRSLQDKPAVTPQPDPERYNLLKEDLEIRRLRLAKQYQTARTSAERESVLAEAQALLDSVLPLMMRCWLGTPWHFYGTSDTPGSGNIACGYFVSTVLRDAGFRVDRFKLAQQPSQNILETFVDRSRRTVRAGISYDQFLNIMASKPAGIYIVGLDRHVGFIVNEPSGIRFIHSSGITPRTVVDESSDQAYSLEHSKYRVFGHLTGEPQTLVDWLQTKSFKVKGT